MFELSPPKKNGGAWTEKVLYSFKSGADGANPSGGLLLDEKGTAYGTTYRGGGSPNCHNSLGTGCGTVFKLTPTNKGRVWGEKILHRFSGDDGGLPNGSLVVDAKGDLYGTAGGGTSKWGVVFRLTPSPRKSGWAETVLYDFKPHDKDGVLPMAGLTFDTSGNLYGTTNASDGGVYGAVFRLKPPGGKGGEWTISAIYGFPGAPDGRAPGATLVRDGAGQLYSTTQEGGTGTCGSFGCGVVFAVKK